MLMATLRSLSTQTAADNVFLNATGTDELKQLALTKMGWGMIPSPFFLAIYTAAGQLRLPPSRLA